MSDAIIWPLTPLSCTAYSVDMDNALLVLALFAARDASEPKEEAPISRWDTWEICESEYPGLAGATRSTIYRVVDRLVEQGMLKQVGTAQGRSRKRHLLAITAKGKRHLKQELPGADVSVHDLRRPEMSLPAFMDFLVIGIMLGGDHIEHALRRRIDSLRSTLDQALAPVGTPEMKLLSVALEHQAKIELSSLEHFHAVLRR